MWEEFFKTHEDYVFAMKFYGGMNREFTLEYLYQMFKERLRSESETKDE